MAYENLLKSVEESAAEKERELQEKARAAIEEIGSKAKREAEAVLEQHRSEAERLTAVERNKLLYLAKGENKEILITTKDRYFERAFTEAGARLAGIRKDPRYPGIFRKMITEAASALGEDSFSIHIDEQDESLCKKTMADLGISCGVVADLQTVGGLVASTPDGAVIISNTVESRLERAKERIKIEVYTILSGD